MEGSLEGLFFRSRCWILTRRRCRGGPNTCVSARTRGQPHEHTASTALLVTTARREINSEPTAFDNPRDRSPSGGASDSKASRHPTSLSAPRTASCASDHDSPLRSLVRRTARRKLHGWGGFSSRKRRLLNSLVSIRPARRRMEPMLPSRFPVRITAEPARAPRAIARYNWQRESSASKPDGNRCKECPPACTSISLLAGAVIARHLIQLAVGMAQVKACSRSASSSRCDSCRSLHLQFGTRARAI
jgi:hypothetical protein